MQIKPRYIFLLLLVISYTSKIFSQEGNPFITHFKECKDIETQNWSICQDNHNVMLLANRRGIMSFDGQKWQITRIPHIPVALNKNPVNNIVYVGANNNYGYLKRNTTGLIEYISLSSDTTDVGVISKIIFKDSSIYFYGDKTISRHSISEPNDFKRWISEEEKPFTGIILTSKNTFINVYGLGLHRLESDTLFPIVSGFKTRESEILFSLPFNNQRVLIGTDQSKLYTFDGVKFYDYDIDDENYLQESILADGKIISDTLYVFGTLNGGIEIVEIKSGKLIYTINYQNGLPDDEIYSLGLDNNNGLWVSHEFGVSRVSFELPIRNYTSYPGIKGNLISSAWHNNELYVATNEGVFYLSEVKDYDEISYWVKVNQIKKEPGEAFFEPPKEEIEEETKRPAKRLFSRLFSKKEQKTKVKETEAAAPTPTKKPKAKAQPQFKYIKKTKSKLNAINYIFRKIESLNDKCTQLVSTENGLLVASNNGLYIINEYKATEITGNRYINQISKKTFNSCYFVATNDGLFSVYFEDNKWKLANNFAGFSEPVYSVSPSSDHAIWLGSDDLVYYFSLDTEGLPFDFKEYTVETDFPEKYKLNFNNDTILLFLESGVFYHDTISDSFEPHKNNYFSVESAAKSILNQQGLSWIKVQDKWILVGNPDIWNDQEIAYLKLFENITSIIADDNSNVWVIDNNRQLLKIIHDKQKLINPNFNIFFNTITNEQDVYFELSNLVFNSDNKTINVNIIAPYYVKKNSTYYQYFVEGLMNNWSKWSTAQNIDLIVKSGTYTLDVRARDIWGNKSEVKSLSFTVKPPFTETIWFYIILVIVVIALFYVISEIREKKLIKDKKILEQRVRERTIEIQNQKEEIETQRDEILFQRDEIYRQKEELTDSINYASRIQKAILPMSEHFEGAFKEHFIIFKPRDIVSGDFYWIAEDEKNIYFTAADCTGHGIPGAFMSMLGITSLNEIFSNYKEQLTANQILTLMREKVKFSLHQTGKKDETKDGMDMALCILHKNENILEYSGAYNPLYLIRNGELIEYKADKMPIGIYHVEKESFTNNEIKTQKNDVIYIFSDGYVDQFGGPNESKFKSANLKELLVKIYSKPMEEQKQILEEKFENWKGELDQIDDVIFIGIRI